MCLKGIYFAGEIFLVFSKLGIGNLDYLGLLLRLHHMWGLSCQHYFLWRLDRTYGLLRWTQMENNKNFDKHRFAKFGSR